MRFVRCARSFNNKTITYRSYNGRKTELCAVFTVFCSAGFVKEGHRIKAVCWTDKSIMVIHNKCNRDKFEKDNNPFRVCIQPLLSIIYVLATKISHVASQLFVNSLLILSG